MPPFRQHLEAEPLSGNIVTANEVEASPTTIISDQSKEESMRRVTFNPRVNVAEVRNREDYSCIERNSIWYNDYEMEQIEHDCYEEARNYKTEQPTTRRHHWCGLTSPPRNNSLLVDASSTVRGLEFIMPRRGSRMVACQRIALRAVLNEQSIQKLSGKHNPDRIGNLYHNVSNKCRNEAIQAAADDAEVAAQITYQEEIERKTNTDVFESQEANEDQNCCFMLFAPLSAWMLWLERRRQGVS